MADRPTPATDDPKSTLTVAQLAAMLGVSPRAVQKAVAEGRYVTAVAVEGRGGRSGVNWRISADDPALSLAIRRPQGPVPRKSKPETVIKEDRRMNLPPEALPKSEQDEAAVRLRAVTAAGSVPPGVSRGAWMSQVASREGISRPTLYRWIAEAKKGKFGRDKAAMPVIVQAEAGPIKVDIASQVFSPQAAELGLSLRLSHPTVDTKEIYRQVCAEARKEGWDVGSLASFYRMIGALPDPLLAYAEGGRRAVEGLVKPAILRDFEAYHVYEVLVGDQHIFDYAVLDDDGDVVRPQMFAWADFRSRFFSGIWPVMGSYDKYAVGFALREACRWGIPKLLYTDWGKPEGSRHVQALRRQLAGLSACRRWDEDENGLPQKKAKPRNAQAKPIESWFFHAVEGPLKNQALPGFCRRDRDERRNEFITETLKEETKGQKLLPAKAFFEIVVATFEAWHDHVMTDGRTIPRRVFEQGIRTAPVAHLDDATLDFIFLPAERRTVKNSTVAVKIAGHGRVTWYAPELASLCRRGRKALVEVRFDPYNPETAHILDAESLEHICTAERWGVIDPHDAATVSDKIRRQNQLTKWFGSLVKDLRNRSEGTISQFTPYAEVVRETAQITDLRTGLTVNGDALDRKIIDIAEAKAREIQARAQDQ